MDERAEVGLLSRNIVIQGDEQSAATERGGYMIFVNAGGTEPIPIIHIEGVEIRRMGWKGLPGRYPVHFHKLGDAPGNYVRSSSIHHCYNRALTIHGTNDVIVKDVVAYDSWGHMFFLEDKVEVRNTLKHNLGLVTRLPVHPDEGMQLGDISSATGKPYFTSSDANVSTYWITNTDNTFENNVAAGSDRHGIWYQLNDGGPIAVTPVRFTGNVAHSNGVHGFFNEGARMITVDYSQPDPLSQLNVASVFSNFTAYKNRNAGVWQRSYGMGRWINARVADNLLGFYLASEGFQQDYQIYSVSTDPPYDAPPFTEDPFNQDAFPFSLTGAPGFSYQTLESCVIVGESGNVGNPTADVELNWPGGARSLPDPANPQMMIKGIESYDGTVSVEGTTFYNFNDAVIPSPPAPVSAPGGIFDYRASAGMGSKGSHSLNLITNSWGVDPRISIRTSSFVNVQHPVLFPIPHEGQVGEVPGYPGVWYGFGNNGVASAMFFDVDGSIPGIGGGPNTYVANNTPLLRPIGYAAPTPLPNAEHYAEPIFVPGPGTAGDDAFGQFSIIFSISPYPNTVPYIDFDPVHRPGQVYRVYSPFFSTHYPITLLLENPANLASPGVEHYSLSYPPASAPPGEVAHDPEDDPRDLQMLIKFSEADRAILVDIPYDGGGAGPTSVEYGSGMIPGVFLPLTLVASVAEVENGDGTQYYYDATAKRLYLRPTLASMAGTAIHPIFEGRELIYVIDG